MAEHRSRKRRIVRRTVMAMVVMVLLFGGYVSSFLAVQHTAGSRFWHFAVNSWFYRPLSKYEFSDHVGHVEFRALCTWVRNGCHRSLWHYIESESKREREGGDLFELRRKYSSTPPEAISD